MRILLTRLDERRHALEIVRDDGSRDRAELETKSLWLHDLLHYAVESEAGIRDGFWGALASGKSMAEMNDRTGEGMKEYAGTMSTIEMLVGAMTGAAKGAEAAGVVDGIRNFMETSGRGAPPDWLTADFVARVQERMRKLVGHWNGTPFGGTMELDWK